MTRRGWFTVTQIGPDAWELLEPIGTDTCRSFVVAGARDAAILDTGEGIGDFAGLVAALTDRAPIVLHSHAHWDHIGASHHYRRVLVHPAEADDLRAGLPHARYMAALGAEAIAPDSLPAGFDVATAAIPGVEPSAFINDGDRIVLGGRVLEAFHTPGHSPGGITLLDRANRLLFPGDAVDTGNIFLHFEGGDPAAWRGTIQTLAELAEHADAIYPTHGAAPLAAADIRAIRDAYEEVWSGARQPTEQRQETDEHGASRAVDLFNCGRFTFWLPAGTYGDGAT